MGDRSERWDWVDIFERVGFIALPLNWFFSFEGSSSVLFRFRFFRFQPGQFSVRSPAWKKRFHIIETLFSGFHYQFRLRCRQNGERRTEFFVCRFIFFFALTLTFLTRIFCHLFGEMLLLIWNEYNIGFALNERIQQNVQIPSTYKTLK